MSTEICKRPRDTYYHINFRRWASYFNFRARKSLGSALLYTGHDAHSHYDGPNDDAVYLHQLMEEGGVSPHEGLTLEKAQELMDRLKGRDGKKK